MRVAFACVLSLLATSFGAAAEPLQTTPLPIEAIAAQPAVNGIVLSPDGKHMAGLVYSPQQKWPVISIWDVENLSKPAIWIPSTTMRPRQVAFLGNEHIIFFADQPLDYNDEGSGGFLKRTFTIQAAVSDLQGKEITQPFSARGALDDFAKTMQRRGTNYEILLDGSIQNPDTYIVRVQNLSNFSAGIYTLDTKTLRAERVAQEASDESTILTDIRDGQLMVREKLRSTGDGYLVVREVRNRTSGSWEEHPELGYLAKQRYTIDPLGFFDADPNKLYVATDRNSNYQQIRVYDIATRTWEPEPAFASPDADIVAVTGNQDRQTKTPPTGPLAYVVDGPSRKVVFVDDHWGPIQRTLENQFRGNNITISDRNNGLGRAIVTVSGSRQPPVYYILLNNKELKMIGKSKPTMDSATFGETKYVTYKARDGLVIPGLLTLPAGYDKARHGPIPVVVLPHGGPWARDYLGWDSSGWPQFLSTRGYGVLQPQYRGSQGLGLALWKAGDKEWGQKMSDDNDDGAAWLVSEGIADPKRMAIFGYSYGGFAAIAASVRPASPFRCAIAGAGVADLHRLGNLWGENQVQREVQGWTVTGMDPMENVAKANIPIMLYHGDRDTQAETRHSRDFVSAMKSAGKDVEYHEIKDMWHQLPWWPEWHRELLGYIESYLAGPKCFGGAK